MRKLNLTNVQITPEGREQIQRMQEMRERSTVTLAGRVPLVLTIEGRDGPVPDKLEWIAPDGTHTEYAIVESARFERLIAAAAVLGQRFAVAQPALDALQESDLDPLP